MMGDQGSDRAGTGTLADVLYGSPPAVLVREEDWVSLVRGVASGDDVALHELYARAHRVVFTLAMRLTRSRETAEEVTVDVFHDVWRRAGAYDPAAGTVVGWIMNQARSRAIDRIRHDHRKKRVPSDGESPPQGDEGPHGPQEALEAKQRDHRLRDALTHLTPGERQAIEVAFFSELSYAETAAQLDEPVGTVKTRIRSGLSKLRQALGEE